MTLRVLIVAKTRRGGGACVGGLTPEGRSVRLIAADADRNERAGLEYNVGDVWQIEAAPDPHIVPPHVENIIVRSARFLKRLEDLIPVVERLMPPVTGGPERLFDGVLQALPSGALYVAERTGLPARSTMFWRPDRPLQRDVEGKRIRYRYPTDDGGRTPTFVGFQEPLEEIPAGTLLRVSIAHWWRPADQPEEELRCHVQLSGWFLPTSASASSLSPRQRAPTEARADCPADLTRARQLLKQTFGFSEFLPLQEPIVARILQRRDTLVIMPTGGGKSLCYQLPALLLDGLTVVVSPLIALMEDQVQQLRQLAVPAAFLNSTLALRDYTRITRGVRHGEVRIVYVAPETLLRPETLVLLEQSRLACFAVDEAHCISEWGHDFRPEYRQLQEVRRRFPQAVCVALTATATPRVREDIRRLLDIEAAGEFVASFNRPNLFLACQPRHDGLRQTLDFLERHRGQSGIIYCSTRKQVDDLAAELAARGWPAQPYHAGLDDETRRRHQEAFLRDDAAIMVATVAFGMGINKSNVRFVLHYNLPRDLESYYQEIGRAGRDGLPADCLLLHSPADASTIRHFIHEGAATERAGRQARLEAMIRYARTTGCRRVPLLAYFGEALGPGRGQVGSGGLGVDAPQTGQAPAAEPSPVPGCGHCDNCQTLQPPGEWTDRGRAVLGGERVFLRRQVASVPARDAAAERTEHDPTLFELLRGKRRELADQAGVPPYVIFSDRTLIEMATCLPRTTEQFLAIQGVGEAKLAAYGEAFLDVIRVYCVTHNVRPHAGPAAAQAEPAGWLTAKRRFQEVGEAFVAGATLDELTARFGVTRETILQNLQRYAEAGHPLDGNRLLQASRLPRIERERVFAAFERRGDERLAPIHTALGGAVDYAELRLLRLVWRQRAAPRP